MEKAMKALTVVAFLFGILDLVFNVAILQGVTHKPLTESVGLTHPKVVKVSPTATPTLVTVTATPSGMMNHSFKYSPSVSPLPSHVILKK